MNSSPLEKVAFVSGANGFIAQHIIKLLLLDGFKVIGSVRDDSKGKHLCQIINSNKFNYEVVEDLIKPGAFDEALKKHPDTTIFFHAASPVTFVETSDALEKMITPAIEGTKNALNAIENYGINVRKVVITSSFASVKDTNNANKSHVYTEKDHNSISLKQGCESSINAYVASKTFAEQEVLKFIKSHNPKFEIITTHSVFVFGPQAYLIKDKSNLNITNQFVTKLLQLKPDDEIPSFSGSFIDVRDVAKAHIIPFYKELKNKRLGLYTDKFSNELIISIINKEYPHLKLPKGDILKSYQQLKYVDKIDFSQTEQELGLEYISLEKSIIDVVKQFIES